jgi:hypothetical protein
VFELETKRAATVVRIGFGGTEAGWWPLLVSGQSRDARGGKPFGPEVNTNALSGARRPQDAAGLGGIHACRRFGGRTWAVMNSSLKRTSLIRTHT